MIENYQNQQYVTIRQATKVTGLSECYLRRRCRERSIPVLQVGNRFMICMGDLLQQLAHEAHSNVEA